MPPPTSLHSLSLSCSTFSSRERDSRVAIGITRRTRRRESIYRAIHERGVRRGSAILVGNIIITLPCDLLVLRAWNSRACDTTRLSISVVMCREIAGGNGDFVWWWMCRMGSILASEFDGKRSHSLSFSLFLLRNSSFDISR